MGDEGAAPLPTKDHLGMPIIPCEGGPYDGHIAHAGTTEIRTTFFPDRIALIGPEGSAVYMLVADDQGGRVGEFAYMGTE